MEKKLIFTAIVSIFLGTAILAQAQTYEKNSDSAIKVTQSVSTVYDIAKIKERITDLNDYITVANAQIIKYNEEIAALNKLLEEATKVGIDVDSISATKVNP